MDGFDDLFEVFSTPQTTKTNSTTPQQSTTTPQQQSQNTKRPLDQNVDGTSSSLNKKTKSPPPSTTTTTSKSTTMTDDNETKGTQPNELVSLTDTTQLNILPSTGVQKTTAEIASEEYDVFNGYFDQVVIGTDNKDQDVKDQTQKTCSMQTCFPPLFNHQKYQRESHEQYLSKIASTTYKPAKTYPFTLDPFQAKAVECIEKNQSVLVAAHTSAGKTVVAEYAIALSLKLGQRVIYTSPIKALSNQKYRELQAEFHDVGLMTGDVTINANASCLVMTTEILRNMLYRGSEVLREISWVIFDEVHYMRDRSRGVVWEETIILLPHKCRFVFLSATLLNSAEFASWVAKVHNQPCSVIYTNYRPTPLEHYVCGRGSDGIHLVVDKHGEFREANFQKAITALIESETGIKSTDDTSGGLGADKDKKKKSRAGVTSEDEVEVIVRKVKELQLDPCIVFSFSKKDCERFAKSMMKIDFCTEDERSLIMEIYKRAINGLTEQDRKLPQVQELAPLLKQGIGVHHGGLLPILKEVVELLFQEGLIRVLFSTETFSIGLNMPARTVIFTSMFKWDGLNRRALTSGEYIQMSGRAGRRGLDDKGVVILMLNQEVETNVVKEMMAGPSDPLMSSFKLGYNMLLNLVRLEESKPDHLMLRSFYQFQQQRAVPMLSHAVTAVQLQRQTVIESIKDLIANQVAITTAVLTPPTTKILTGKEKKHLATQLKQQEKQKLQQGKTDTTTSTTSTAPSSPSPPKYPIIQVEDIQHYFAVRQNLYEQRQILRTLLHRPEFVRPAFINNPGRLIHIKGCIREGPPPLHGSAAEMAILESYNQPLIVNNNDLNIAPLEFALPVQESFSLLRSNRTIIDGENANQSTNIGASNHALVRQDDIMTETGIVPPGLGLTQARLSQLAVSNKASFLEIQRRRLKDLEMNFGWGIVINVAKRTLPDMVLFGSHTPLPPVITPTKPIARDPKNPNEKDKNINESREVTIFDVLLAVDPDTVSEQQEIVQTTSNTFLSTAYALHSQTRPCPPHKQPKYIIVPILASAINAISSICVTNPVFKTSKDRIEMGFKMKQIQERLEANAKEKPIVINYNEYDPTHTNQQPFMFPLIDTNYKLYDLFHELQIFTPHINLGQKKSSQNDKNKKDPKDNKDTTKNQLDDINTDLVRDMVALNHRISKLHQQLTHLKLHSHPLRDRFLTLYHHKITLDGYRTWLNYKLARVSKDKTLEATLIAMNRVLRNLQLITEDDIITNKGRVACEVSTCDELVGTELLYSSIFNQLDIKQVASLCSCLVFEEGNAADEKIKLSQELEPCYNQLEEHLKNIATIVKQANIPIDINKYVQSFNPFLMEVVYRWCEGATFATIMKDCNKTYEGTVVRVMRRLEELLRQFATAAATIGNTELEDKFNASVLRIKRDIVFAASLYL